MRITLHASVLTRWAARTTLAQQSPDSHERGFTTKLLQQLALEYPDDVEAIGLPEGDVQSAAGEGARPDTDPEAGGITDPEITAPPPRALG